MFVVERAYSGLTINEFLEYLKDIPKDTKINKAVDIVKETLKEEVKNGFRDEVTGERVHPNQKSVNRVVSFVVYYHNTGVQSSSRTIKVLNKVPEIFAEITDSEVIDKKCSKYIYKITIFGDKKLLDITDILYRQGGSAVYLNS